MTSKLTLRLAARDDALAIARLSRDRIEQGLGWSWTAPRVLRSILQAETNAVVALDGEQLLGFGIMKYGDDEAHLLLLAVHAECVRRGVGTALVDWLETSARVAGVGQVGLEARATNAGARSFTGHWATARFRPCPVTTRAAKRACGWRRTCGPSGRCRPDAGVGPEGSGLDPLPRPLRSALP